MPGTSKAKNPRGVEIEFEEASHIYKSLINGLETRYVSGTQFLSNFFPEFDPDGKIAERCAKKQKITVEQLKKQWEDKGKESCRLGTRLHELCEDIELDRKIRNIPENIIEKKRFENGKSLATKLRNSIDILGVEKIVFSDRLPTPIAGTIDLFGQSRKDGSYLILDWKTNKTIDTYNKFNQFCLDPIQHLPDLNFQHYALQLSLYEYILKFENYVPKNAKFKRALLHITENKSEIIQTPDLSLEIRDLIIQNEILKKIS